MVRNDFYVYLIFGADGQPRYVGKGIGSRAESHVNRSRDNRLLRKEYGKGQELPLVFLREGLTEKQAFDYEKEFIIAIGRLDLGSGPLFNRLRGGGGISQAKSKTHAKAIGDGLRGKRKSAQHKAALKVAASKNGHKKSGSLKAYFASLTPAQKAARSKLISERTKRAMKNKEVRAKISRALTGKAQSEEQKRLSGEGVRRKYASDPVFFAKMRELLKTKSRMRGKKHSDETRAKMSASHLRRLQAASEAVN